jgi:hypothetical protein
METPDKHTELTLNGSATTTPAINGVVIKQKKTTEDRRKELMRQAIYYRRNIQQDVVGLKRDVTIAAVAVGAAYVSYRVVRALFAPAKPKTTAKENKKENIRYVAIEPPRKRGGFSIFGLVIERVTNVLLDNLIDTLQENLSSRRKRDAE